MADPKTDNDLAFHIMWEGIKLGQNTARFAPMPSNGHEVTLSSNGENELRKHPVMRAFNVPCVFPAPTIRCVPGGGCLGAVSRRDRDHVRGQPSANISRCRRLEEVQRSRLKARFHPQWAC
jgi:hypothetical protein